MTVKIVPSKVYTIYGGLSEVTGSRAHPPRCHPESIIRADCMALEVQTNFGSRWYGVKRAWIGSDLRMRVELLDDRFEEMMSWPDVPTIDKTAAKQLFNAYTKER